MHVKEKDIDTRKIKGYGICKKNKYQVSLLGGPTTPTYCTLLFFAVEIVQFFKVQNILFILMQMSCYLFQWSKVWTVDIQIQSNNQII